MTERLPRQTIFPVSLYMSLPLSLKKQNKNYKKNTTKLLECPVINYFVIVLK